MSQGVADGYSAPLGATIAVSGEAPVVEEVTETPPAPPASGTATEPIHTGGGWYTWISATGEDQKIQGREAAYEAAGIPLPADEE